MKTGSTIARVHNLGARAYLKYVKSMVRHSTQSSTATSHCRDPIAVLIPVIEKDMPVLPYVIRSIRRFVAHPISEIVVVSPPSKGLHDLCQAEGCTFLDENCVLPINKRDLRYVSNGRDRSGWLFQQLLKLSCDGICRDERCLVVDADTVFTRVQCFENAGKTILNTSDEYHVPYRRAFSRLLGYAPKSPVSFVAHHMVFERQILSSLKKDIELVHRKAWYQAIIDCIDRSDVSGFSEYETYGNYAYINFREHVELQYWFHHDLTRADLNKLDLDDVSRRYGMFKSVSFQHYNG
ncbi:MAG: DUF6492 family protein [Alicyclobacillus sp.]|nr:DUF6492 family protein [Alicyclobacillus sp.]